MGKLYQSEKWLKRKYLVEKMDVSAIAKLCGVTDMTIYLQLHKLGLIKKR